MSIWAVASAMLCGMAFALEAGPNLLSNAAFQSADGHVPVGWTALHSKKSNYTGVYVCTGGVMRISQVGSAALREVTQTVAIDGNHTYWFEVDVLCDALDARANVRYSYIDDKGNEHRGEKPLFFYYYAGPQPKWKRAAVPIPAPDPTRTWKKLKIRLLVVNSEPGRALPDRAIYFRNPTLTHYAGQKNVPMNHGSGGTRYTKLSERHFGRLPDRYRLEDGGVGSLDLAANRLPQGKDFALKVGVPTGVSYELYGRIFRNTPRKPGEARVCRRLAEVTPNVFKFPRKPQNLLAYGLHLLFAADDRAPRRFEIALTLQVDGSDDAVTQKIAVERLVSPPPAPLPRTRRYAAYNTSPMSCFDDTTFKEPLARALKAYWQRTGWVEDSNYDFTGALHYRQTMAKSYAREGVGPDGAPIGAPCDSAIVALGAEGIVRHLASHAGAIEGIQKHEHTTWDYEPYVLGPVTIGCFCADCRTAFAKDQRLTTVPDARTILRDHRAAWVSFRCGQRAESVRTAVEALKRINPKTKFCLCSERASPGTDDLKYFTELGIDLARYVEFTDVFRSMNYSFNADSLRSLEREIALGRPVQTLFCNGWEYPQRAGCIVGMQLFAAFFAGLELPFIAPGFNHADGDQLIAIRKALQDVAATEHLWGNAPICRKKFALEPESDLGKVVLYSLDREAADGTRYVLVVDCSGNTEHPTPCTATVRPFKGYGEPRRVTLTTGEWKLLTFPRIRK